MGRDFDVLCAHPVPTYLPRGLAYFSFCSSDCGLYFRNRLLVSFRGIVSRQ